MDDFNAASLEVITAHLEPALGVLSYQSDCAPGFTPGTYRNPRVQFERLGCTSRSTRSPPGRNRFGTAR